MKFAINRWRMSDKEFSGSKLNYIRRLYFKHLLKLGLPNDSHLLLYFAKPFFHDSILTKFEFNSWKNEAAIEIVRSEADSEDINDYRKKNGLPKISESKYMKNPIIYNFTFKKVMECRYSFSSKYIDSFWIMDSEIAKEKNGLRLTLAQDINSEVSLTFKESQFTLLNKSAVVKYSNGKLRSMPYCGYCKQNMMTGQMIKNEIKKR